MKQVNQRAAKRSAKGILRRCTSILLTFLLIASMFIVSSVSAGAANPTRTQAEAVAWAKSQVGIGLDYDNNGYWCVDVIAKYLEYLGMTSLIGGDASAYAYKSMPAGWTKIPYSKGQVAQPGDIVVWTWTSRGGSRGHVAVVISANASQMTVIDQQASDHIVTGYTTYSYGNSSMTLYGFIRPAFKDGPTPHTHNYNIDGGYQSAHPHYKIKKCSCGQSTTTSETTWLGYCDTCNPNQSLGSTFYAKIIHNISSKAVTETGNNVDLRTLNTDNLKQYWKFDRQSDGSYRITNVDSGKCLDVNGASATNGANIQTYDMNQSTAQKWKIKQSGEGYAFVPECATSSALDLNGGNTADGTNIQLYSWSQGNAQRFRIEKELNTQLEAPNIIGSAYSGNSITFYLDFTSTTVKQHFSTNLISELEFKVWKGTADVGEPYWKCTLSKDDTKVKITEIPSGEYEGYLCAKNGIETVKSSIKKFTIEYSPSSYRSYRVAGVPELCGEGLTGIGWDPNDDNNLMTYNETKQRYEKTYYNVPRKSEPYEFKITSKDSDGRVSWIPNEAGMGNSTFSVTDYDYATVTIWYEVGANCGYAEVTKGEPPKVEVESVKLSQETAELEVGDILQLEATVLPDNATDKKITWSSNDTDVATVENGKVTAKEEGTAIITAKASNGKSASCEVRVRENYRYEELNDGTVEITEYRGSDANVNIPAKINGKSVSSIGEWAFEGNDNIKSVVIPEGVKKFDAEAFLNCENLTSITIPKSVYYMDFDEHAVGFIWTPESEYVKSDKLTITGYKYSSAYLYAKLSGLKFKSMGEIEPYWIYDSYNGQNSIEIIGYTGDEKNLNIPQKVDGKTVSAISYNAFKGYKDLTSVVIPEGVENIGDEAFFDCENLTNITIPKSVYYIESEYTSVGFITDPDGMYIGIKSDKLTITGYKYSSAYLYANKFGFKFNSIGETQPYWIYNKNADTEDLEVVGYTGDDENLVIPSQIDGHKVTSVAHFYYSSWNKDKIKSVTVSEGITKIGHCGFANLNNLVKVSLPKGLKTLAEDAFYNCPKLKSLTIPDKTRGYGSGAGAIGEYLDGDVNRNVEGFTLYCNKFSDFYQLAYELGYDFVSTGEESPWRYDYYGEDENEIAINYDSNTGDEPEFEIPSEIDGHDVVAITGIKSSNIKKITIPSSVAEIYDGTLGYYSDGIQKVSDFTICGYKNTAAEDYANKNGFSFVDLDKEQKPVMKGDVNGDGAIDAIDARWILQASTGNRELNAEQKAAADMNGDGEIDAIDARWILQVSTGIRKITN